MEHEITIKLKPEVYQPLQELALLEGRPLEEIASERLAQTIPSKNSLSEQARKLAEEKFARHLGAVRSGNSRSADNDQIDADLAHEYGASHNGK